jgi:hypothetical protein
MTNGFKAVCKKPFFHMAFAKIICRLQLDEYYAIILNTRAIVQKSTGRTRKRAYRGIKTMIKRGHSITLDYGA